MLRIVDPALEVRVPRLQLRDLGFDLIRPERRATAGKHTEAQGVRRAVMRSMAPGSRGPVVRCRLRVGGHRLQVGRELFGHVVHPLHEDLVAHGEQHGTEE